MGDISDSPLTQNKKLKLFPWIKAVNRRFSKCIPADYDLETLNFFLGEVEKEMETISISSLKKNEALFSTLMGFYNHFCWKIKWKEDSPHMKSACAKLLSSLSKVGLVLSKGSAESKWLNQVLSALKVFPGDNDSIYSALLHIYKLKKKYQPAYSIILRHMLCSTHHSTQEPSTYFKLMLLFRRLKFLLTNPHERVEITSLASRVATPLSTISWLISNNLEELCKIKMKRMGHQLMRKKFNKTILEELREVILPDMCIDKSMVLEEDGYENADQFFIDFRPEVEKKGTLGEDIPYNHTKTPPSSKKKKSKKGISANTNQMEEQLDLEENIDLNQKSNKQLVKSKRKSIMDNDESDHFTVSKKQKKIELVDNFNVKKRFAKNEESVSEQMSFDSFDLIDSSHESSAPSYSDFASQINSNSPSNSHKKSKKNNKIQRDTVSQNENVVNVSLSHQPTIADESGTSKKNKKKKRKTLNVTQEEIDSQGVTKDHSDFNDNDSACVESIKESKKKKRKTKNVTQDEINAKNINKSQSNFNENESNSFCNSMPDHVISASKKNKKMKTSSLSPNDNQLTSDNVESFEKVNTSDGNDNTPITKKHSAFKKYLKEQELIAAEEGKILSVQSVNEEVLESSFKVDKRRTSIRISKQKSLQKKTVDVVENNKVDKVPETSYLTEDSYLKLNDNAKHPNSSLDLIDKTDISNTEIISKSQYNSIVVESDLKLSRVEGNTKLESICTVNETKPFESNKEPEISIEEIEAIENISKTEAVDSIAEAEAVEFTAEVEAVESTAEAVETIVETEALETIDETEAVETNKETEAVETIVEAEAVKTIVETEAVETIDETEAVGTIADTEAVETIEETEAVEMIEKTVAVEMIEKTVAVETIDETEAVGTIADTEAVETIDETIVVETMADTEAVETIAETEAFKAIIEEEAVESIAEAEDVESTAEAEAVVSIAEAEAVEYIAEAEAVEYIAEAEAVESIAETEAVETIAETEAVETIDETESVEAEADAVKYIAEAETVETIVEAEAIETIVEAEAIETIEETVAVETVDETEAVGTVVDTGAVETIDEAVESISETEAFKAIVEEEAVEFIAEAEAVESTAEAEAVESTAEAEAVESIAETEEVEMIDETEAVETIEKTESVDSEAEAVESIAEAEAVEPIAEAETIETIVEAEETIKETEECNENSLELAESDIKNISKKDIASLSSKISFNPDIIVKKELKSMVNEESSSEDNIQNQNMETSQLSETDYCKILLKEVTEDNFDSDVEITDDSKNTPCSDSRNTIPDIQVTQNFSEENIGVQMDKVSSIINHIGDNFAEDNGKKVVSKEGETVESIAESLYRKILIAKEERTSLRSCVSEKVAADILTENTVNYVMEKVIGKVECVDNIIKGQSFENLKCIKKDIKFSPEQSQLPKLGNLSNLKPFGFPNEKSECLSFVDVLQDNGQASREIEDSQSSAQSPAKRNDFYPYRNLLAIEVPDDQSESNFSDFVASDKLDETICVSDESSSSDSDDEMTTSESPACSKNDVREEKIIENSELTENAEAIIDEPMKPKTSKNKQKLNVQTSPDFSTKTSSEESEIANAETSNKMVEGSRRDSGELINLVQTIKVPIINLGRCDEECLKYQKEDYSEGFKNDSDVAHNFVSDKSENEIPSTGRSNNSEKQNVEVVIKKLSPTNSETSMHNQESKDTGSGASSEKLDEVNTRTLRRRNTSATETDKSEVTTQKQETPEKSRCTRLRRKPSTQKTSQSTESKSAASSTTVSSRRSSKRLKKDINVKLREEFNELRLGSPTATRRNPVISKVRVDISDDSDDNVESLKVEKRTTRSSAANSKACPPTKAESDHCDPSVEEACSNKKESLKEYPKVMKRAKRSTTSKITKYFSSKSTLDLTPVTEKVVEDEDANSGESSTENLTAKKRSTRSASLVTDLEDSKSKPEFETFPIDEEKTDIEDTKALSNKVKSSKDNVITVRRSMRATSVTSEKGGSESKLSQIPIHEESDGENADTCSTVSEESLKENTTIEEDKDYCTKSKTIKSSARAYNLRSKRILIRPSKLNILKKTEDNHP